MHSSTNWLALPLSNLTLRLLFIMKLCSYLNRKKAPRDQLKTFTSNEPFSYQGMYLMTKCWQIFRFRLHTDEFFPIYVGANWEATERLPHLIVKQRPYLLAILPRTSHPITLTERHRATTIPGVCLVWRQRLEPFHSNTASTRGRGGDGSYSRQRHH